MASANSLKVDLHKNFAEWVNQEGLTSPTEDQWKEIMEEDCRYKNMENCCRYMYIIILH